jgi:hypothetical protein
MAVSMQLPRKYSRSKRCSSPRASRSTDLRPLLMSNMRPSQRLWHFLRHAVVILGPAWSTRSRSAVLQRVKSADLTARGSLPIFPNKRTISASVACLKSANFGSERTHSIASSARAGSEGGMVSSISGHARPLARCDRASREGARAQDHVRPRNRYQR